MITFQTYNEIRLLRNQKCLSCEEIALRLHLDIRTIKKWADRDRYEPRKAIKASSILDPYKLAIRRDMELGECTSTEIFNRLKQVGYPGGYTIINKYISILRIKLPDQDKQLILPFEWMLRLIQGKLTPDMIATDLGTLVSSGDISILVLSIHDGTLKVRNKAIAVLAYMKNIPRKAIAQFLMVDHRVVEQYIQSYELDGIVGLFAPRKGGPWKHEQDVYKTAVFDLLHSPPQSHGINRTSWRMADLIGVLKQRGIMINKDSIRQIIKKAGFKFRKAKRVLTSNDPEYRDKLQEITRTLSSLTESQKFFSIDEFGPFSVKMQGGRALTAPGQERVVPQWQKSKGSLTLIGALELSTNQITHFYADRKSTVEMIKLTRILLDHYHDESRLYLSWDAASWHASKAFFAEVARINEYGYRLLHHTPSVMLVPLPASAQFLNVIESIFSGMARAIIHNSDYASTEDCKAAIDRYFIDRNEYFKIHPKRAGNKIWGEERVPPVFSPSNNCKDPIYC
jgi:transposase